MRIFLFARRNTKEILRDPINFFFGVGFPLVLLALLSFINQSIPAEAGNTMFAIQNLAPGVATFGPVFMALFSGMLLSKDRTSSFLTRLFTSPMTSVDFIAGYTLPMVVMAALQAAVTFLAAGLFGLTLTRNILLAIVVVMPVAVLFIGFGLLCGSLMNDKAVGGICGALLTNVAGWLSGVWIPLDMIGGAFKAVAAALPFYHGAEATKAAISGNFGELPPHLAVVLIYAGLLYALAVVVFRRKMRGDTV
ncbi:MAG: ABC transporter permease [Firmicutes bacterium]|nr:ABC transporter permease [Bacillota bacterium]